MTKTKTEALERAAEVTVGSTWFKHGKHMKVLAERTVNGEREVQLAEVGKRPGPHSWVAAWRVVQFGTPSEFYNDNKEDEVATTTSPPKKESKNARRRATRSPATDTLAQVKKISAREAAVQVLTRAKGKLPIATIQDRVLEMKHVKLGGETPRATVAKSISLEVAKPDGRIVRVEPGVYDLRSRAGKGARV